tara:strand:- start:291 stop:704 length:414 start_codon:yes stop_codon:yes gene_type:complete
MSNQQQEQQEECDRCGRADVLECHSSKCIDHDEEWSVRGYYYDKEPIVDDDYFKSFKKLHEASIFYNSITKEKCNAGKVLYKEPYEEIILEESFNEECRCPSYNCKNVGTIYSEEYDEKVCADCEQEQKNATEWIYA